MAGRALSLRHLCYDVVAAVRVDDQRALGAAEEPLGRLAASIAGKDVRDVVVAVLVGCDESPDEAVLRLARAVLLHQQARLVGADDRACADLVEESKQTIENLKDEVRDVGDEAERATRETENSLELRTRDRYRKLISKIDSTLKRVDSGDYGFCVDTGEEIGLERLEARLTAERTIDAQERWEHMQKQMGD